MNLYTEQQMRDAIKMARNGARSEDNIIDSLNFIKQHSEVTMSNNKQIEKPLELPHQETIVGTNTIQTKPFDNQKTMTDNKQAPKEKAEELLDKMTMEIGKFNAKQCALIAVDEILSINSVDKDLELSDYWEEVKQEIKNYEEQ
jgi:hypothetical protein